MSIVDLLEGFDAAEHPRGFAGRWVRKAAQLARPAGSGGPGLVARPREPERRHVPVAPSPRDVRPPSHRPRTGRPKSAAQRRYEGGVARMSSATRERLRTAFTPAERAARKGRQPHQDIGALYELAGKHQSHFEHILDRGRGIASRLGARVQSTATEAEFEKAKRDVAANPDRPHVIIAALKGKDRASEKVERKYEGDAGRITDLVRGTVLVPHVDDLAGAIDAIRAELPKGWTISAPENRYVHEPGDHVNTGSRAGYRDVALLLRSPTGFHTELQVNTTHMWLAKEAGAGHKMYERLRTIRETQKGDLSDRQLAELRNLERKSRDLYDRALLRSSRPRKMPGRR